MLVEATAYTEEDEYVEATFDVRIDKYGELSAKFVDATVRAGEKILAVDADRLRMLKVYDELRDDALLQFDIEVDEAEAAADKADMDYDALTD